jgi:hypothetical protein
VSGGKKSEVCGDLEVCVAVRRTPLVGIFGNGEIGIDHYPGSETKYKASDTRSPFNKIFSGICVFR